MDLIERIDENDWCKNRGSYSKHKQIIYNINYDDIIDIYGIPSRICKMIRKDTSILNDEQITSFEENTKYHIEWHCKIHDKYFMLMGWNIEPCDNTTWIIYYPDESKDIIDIVLQYMI